MATKPLIWGSDLYKGFKIPNNSNLQQINDILPFQMITEEEKTIDWIKAVADYYETAGWVNVEKKAERIQRNFWLRNAQLNPNDYIINPTYNEYYEALNIIVPQEQQSPLEQFYPLIPNIVDVLRGEFLKRDTEWTVEVKDQYSKSLVLEQKEEEFGQVLEQFAIQQKQRELAKLGIVPVEDDQEAQIQYEEAMQKAIADLKNIDLKYKNFRTSGAKWAEKTLARQNKKYNLHEIEPDAFESGLICDREFWHLDMQEAGYRLELLNPKWCDYHKGPNTKYVSQGDYFLWFDFMSAGDIVNKYGRRMKEDDILKMKEIYIKTANMLIPDYRKNLGQHGNSAYYDTEKSWKEATSLDPKMNDAMLGQELVYNFSRNPNFEHNMDVDILNPIWGRRITGQPQMFRVMNLYWRSMKRVGLLTKIGRDGEIEYQGWVDEHFKVTVEPKYDKSIIKEEKADNLIYGEHIEWTWVYEWRRVIKISPNQKHTFWLNNNNYQSIYIDGGPCKYQFKSKDNPYDSLPPIEGCEFSYLNTTPFSLVDRLRPMQIIYNVAWNRVPKRMFEDMGIKLAVHKGATSANPGYVEMDGQDPIATYEDKLRASTVVDYSVSPEVAKAFGQPPIPQVLNLSTAQEAQLYLNIASQIKLEAGEVVGVTRQRLGQQKASETATGINQGIIYSETQTEKYYEQHFNLMKRVRQRMLDADLYYATIGAESTEMYQNEMDEEVFINTNNLDHTLAEYEVDLKARANVRAALQKIEQFLLEENTLNFSTSEKIEMLLSKSVPQMMEALKKAEAKRTQDIQAEREHEMQMEEERRKTIMEQQQFILDNENKQKDLDRQKDILIAEIRALGGIQTDVDADSVPDAYQNMELLMKRQELQNKTTEVANKAAFDRQSHIDNMILQKQKMLQEIEKEKLKGEYALKVAKENKTNAELKRKKTK